MAEASGPPGLSSNENTPPPPGPQPSHVIAPPDGAWVEAWLSRPRFARYLTAAGGDRQRGLALYEWNTQVGAALQRDLAHLEIALRNAYDTAASASWTGRGHWLLDGAPVIFAPLYRTKRTGGRGSRTTRRVDVNEKQRRLIEGAQRAAGTGAPPGKVLAELTFGFWRYLSSSAHEKTLWVPHLHRAFPPGTNRVDVDTPVARLHELRNRVAHHEPLLDQDLDGRLQDLLTVAHLLHRELANHLQRTTRLPALLAARP